MAHGFINKGVNTTFVTRKELAWHRLGKTVDAMTSSECMKLAGLDFTVELAPLHAQIGLPISREDIAPSKVTEILSCKQENDSTLYYKVANVSNTFATYRTDTNKVLGTVGNRYEIVQNIEAFDFFDSIIGEGHAKYETAGALGNGETVFITAKLPSKLIVNKEDIDKYLLFTMSHDGTSSITVMFTPIRVVCNNTLNAALASKERVTIRHTQNARTRLGIAPALLGISAEASARYEEVFSRFSVVPINDSQFGEFIDKVFDFKPGKDGELSVRSKNKRNSILEYYEVGIGQEGIQGTLWGAYNAVTGYLQNGKDIKADLQFKNEFLKSNYTTRNTAMTELLTLAK